MKEIIRAGLAELGLLDQVPPEAPEQLAEYGALIMEHRCKFLAAAAPIAAQNYKDISHGAEVLALNYQMCTAAPTAAAMQTRESIP